MKKGRIKSLGLEKSPATFLCKEAEEYLIYLSVPCDYIKQDSI